MFIYDNAPPDTKPDIEAAGSFIEHQNKILLLKRAPEKKGGGKWGLPAGKLEPGESALQAAIRELFEETGIEAVDHQLEFFKKSFVKDGPTLYLFHLFHLKFDIPPNNIQLNHEHTEYKWLTPHEALTFPLFVSEGEIIDLIFKKLS